MLIMSDPDELSEQLHHYIVEAVVFIAQNVEYSQKQDHDITRTAVLAEQDTFDKLSHRLGTTKQEK